MGWPLIDFMVMGITETTCMYVHMHTFYMKQVGNTFWRTEKTQGIW